jgi:hypothetical protein
MLQRRLYTAALKSISPNPSHRCRARTVAPSVWVIDEKTISDIKTVVMITIYRGVVTVSEQVNIAVLGPGTGTVFTEFVKAVI